MNEDFIREVIEDLSTGKQWATFNQETLQYKILDENYIEKLEVWLALLCFKTQTTKLSPNEIMVADFLFKYFGTGSPNEFEGLSHLMNYD